MRCLNNLLRSYMTKIGRQTRDVLPAPAPAGRRQGHVHGRGRQRRGAGALQRQRRHQDAPQGGRREIGAFLQVCIRTCCNLAIKLKSHNLVGILEHTKAKNIE